METHEIPSPASSITKLGMVKFVVPESSPPGDGVQGARSSAIRELPSFSNEASSRPAVAVPPLVDQRADQRAIPEPIDDAFERRHHGGPPPASPQREAPRRAARSWWHAALAGGAL
jgi:hypothetical protein